MESLPAVVEAKYLKDKVLRLKFQDGLEADVDFSDWLEGPVFEPLREPHYFRRFFIEGGTIVWPNGADIAPETLYERARSGAAA